MGWAQRLRLQALLRCLAGLVFLLAALAVWRLVREHDLRDVGRALRAIAPADIAAAALLAAGSYFVLTLFDWLGVRSAVGSDLAYRKIALASLTATSLGHTVGFAALSGSVIRYRMYSRYGLGAADVARIVVFSGMTVAAGHAALAGAAGLSRPAAVADFAGIPTSLALLLGGGALLLLFLYLACAAAVPPEARAQGWRRLLPPLRVACLQTAIGACNYLLVAGALKHLLGDAADVSLLSFASFYVVGNTLAIASHVPGGLGVLELLVLSAVPEAEAVGALIVFRLVYFVVPFAAGVILYCAAELARRAERAPPESGPGLHHGRHHRDVVGSDR